MTPKRPLIAWSCKNDLLCATNTENQAGNPVSTLTVHRRDFDLHSNCMRRLCNEFHDVFQNHRCLESRFQVSSQNGSVPIGSNELQRISIHYQAIIRSVLNHVKKDPENIQQVQYLQHVLLIWSLVDVLLLRSAESLPAADLCEWSQSNLEPESLQNEDFWLSILRLVCTGNIEKSLNLIQAFPNRSADHLVDYLYNLLLAMPPVEDCDKSEWLKWQMAVRRLLDDNYFARRPELENICRVLAGESDFLKIAASELTLKWYEILVGKVLFTNKFCRVYELSEIADVPAGTNMSPMDEILLAIFDLDMINMLKLCSSYFQNWLFVAHLADLIHSAGCSEMMAEDKNIDLREHLMLEYATSLMTHNSLWQLAAEYLLHCPNYGKGALRLYLERLSSYDIGTASDYKILKILEMCRRCDFLDTARSIAKECCMTSLKAHDFNRALSWCLQAEDPQLSSRVAEQLLHVGSQRGQSINVADCLNFLKVGLKSSHFLSNPSLLFLSKYNEFLKLKSTKAPGKVTIQYLSELVTCKVSPRRFWPVLLEELLLLIRVETGGMLHLEEVYNLMDTVEKIQHEIDIVHNGDAFADSVAGHCSLLQLLNDLRLSLNKQLHFALVC